MSLKQTIKITFVGEAGVGKTNIIRVLNDEPFKLDRHSTLNSSFIEKDIIINNKQYTYALWDTAGQEIYRSITKSFIQNSKIVFIVFAINDKKSFKEVDYWINSIKEELKEGHYIMALIGNKLDLFEEQEVSEEDVKKKADELKIDFKLTSAAEDAVGIKQFFEKLMKDFIKNIGFHKELEKENIINLNEEKNKEENNKKIFNNGGKKKKCC